MLRSVTVSGQGVEHVACCYVTVLLDQMVRALIMAYSAFKGIDSWSWSFVVFKL